MTRYDLQYRQKVSSEDMYLGMSGKTPSIGHADELVCKIMLPNTSLKQIEIVSTALVLEVLTPSL
jgi:aconitate hydratase